MGIIKRQGIKSTIINFAGAVIGAFSALFIYSANDGINDEIYGYAQWLYNTAFLFVPLATLGVTSLVVKYFPIFSSEDSKSYNGFLSLIWGALSISFLLFTIIFICFKEGFYAVLEALKMNTEFLKDAEIYLLILVLLLGILQVLTSQSSNKLRIVVPNLIQQFGFKLFLPILVLSFAYFGFSREVFSWGMIGFFVFAALALIIYLWRINGLKLGKVKKPKKDFSFKEMVSYALFGSLNQLSNGIAFRLDAVMIPLFMHVDNVSFYVKAFLFISFIDMPARAINQIAGPIISQAWKDHDLENMNSVYKKASANLFLVGSFLFLGLWYSIPDLVNISSDPNQFPFVETIFLLLGFSKLIDMITSVNGSIIVYSKLYKYNFAFLVFLAVTNLCMNYYWIPREGIVGAALATAFSLFFYNLIKLIFILYNFKLHPFSVSTFKTLVLFTGIFGLSFIINIEFSPLINIILKSVIVAGLFLPIAYFWNISPDLNKFFQEIKKVITTRSWN